MTAYQQPTFTVPTGHREPDTCSHGWLTARGDCVFCGQAQDVTGTIPTRRYGVAVRVKSRQS